jgi:CBS domain-containing protein/anti-sigma regulatory factor (Ser/Thr protein kinase)
MENFLPLSAPPTPLFEEPQGVSAPVKASHQPLVLLELIQRLKVRDVMTRDVVCLERYIPLWEAQRLMKEKHISGIPVVEDGRLFGLISTDDIIRAIEGGYIAQPCGHYMTTKLVVLEDDMPLSIAIQYFDRFHFGRFPVLNRERALVGIVCQRDINRALLAELSEEFNRMEKSSARTLQQELDTSTYMLRDFPVAKYDFENAGKAANAIKSAMIERKFSAKTVRRIAVAAYELEINLCVHSDGGVLSWQIGNGRSEIVAKDKGPGIADVAWACRDGTSTANEWIRSLGFGAGLGLVNVKRVSDEFEITSKVGVGTTVRSVVNTGSPPENQET